MGPETPFPACLGREFRKDQVEELRVLISRAEKFVPPLNLLEVAQLAEACRKLLAERIRVETFHADPRVVFFADHAEEIPLESLEWIVRLSRGEDG